MTLKIIIEKASSDTFWYANHIGDIFEVEVCTRYDFFSFQIQDEKGIRYIIEGDAKVVD